MLESSSVLAVLVFVCVVPGLPNVQVGVDRTPQQPVGELNTTTSMGPFGQQRPDAGGGGSLGTTRSGPGPAISGQNSLLARCWSQQRLGGGVFSGWTWTGREGYRCSWKERGASTCVASNSFMLVEKSFRGTSSTGGNGVSDPAQSSLSAKP